MKIRIIENCLAGGSVFFEGWEGNVDTNLALEMIEKGWAEAYHPLTGVTENTESLNVVEKKVIEPVEKAVGKRMR